MSRSSRTMPVRRFADARHRQLLYSILAVAPLWAGCSDARRTSVDGAADASGDRTSTADSIAVAGDGTADDLLTSLDEQTPELQFALGEWKGDLDGIIAERFRLVRLLTVYEPMYYAVDGARQGGLTFEAAREFENFLNRRLGRERATERVRVVLIPVRRDELIPFIRDGRGDIAAANLTITDERRRDVDFSDPFVRGAYEVVVTGPSAEPVASLQDLSGRKVFVRRSSSYFESLERLNRDLDVAGLPPVEVIEVNEILDDGAILEMVNEGRIPTTIVDAHVAEFWVEMFSDLLWDDDVRARQASEIAWAVQKNTPQLLDQINAFVKTHKKGTLAGNILINRYYRDTDWLKEIEAREAKRREEELAPLFKQTAAEYGLDWRRLLAQARQESGLDQSLRSSRGAVGLMQLMPATAAEMGFPDVSTAQANVAAGAKYMRHVIDTYFPDVENNPAVESERAAEQAYALALAAYNAGPTRISRLRRVAGTRGIDSTAWFDGMDRIVGREVGREPVVYVQNVMAYSIALQMREFLEQDRESVLRSGSGTPAATGR